MCAAELSVGHRGCGTGHGEDQQHWSLEGLTGTPGKPSTGEQYRRSLKPGSNIWGACQHETGWLLLVCVSRRR